MTPSAKVPLNLIHGGEYGNHGIPINADSSFGWQLMIGAGRRTSWLEKTCCTQFCPFCDQEKETINHLLSSCVFACEFWFLLLRCVRLAAYSPQPSDTIFQDWWHRASNMVADPIKKGLNSLIILGA
jgi:hypothetical protein